MIRIIICAYSTNVVTLAISVEDLDIPPDKTLRTSCVTVNHFARIVRIIVLKVHVFVLSCFFLCL